MNNVLKNKAADAMQFSRILIEVFCFFVIDNHLNL